MLILISLLSMVSTGVYANQTKSYSCTIERYYRHPISGQIEDSGGEKSFDIGQGMVEGTVYNSGLIEEASSGQLFLTVTMSLADFSGNYQFWVQEGGENFSSGRLSSYWNRVRHKWFNQDYSHPSF